MPNSIEPDCTTRMSGSTCGTGPALTEPDRIEVVDASDDARLIEESLAAGEIVPAGEGLYYSRSHPKDTARSEERTIVATSDPADAGVYNNWHDAREMRAMLEDRMRGASRGKTMYVVPYLMAPPGSPLERLRRRRRVDRPSHRRPAHDPDGPGRAGASSTN